MLCCVAGGSSIDFAAIASAMMRYLVCGGRYSSMKKGVLIDVKSCERVLVVFV